MEYRYGSHTAHTDQLSADHGAERNHEADQGADIEQAVRRVSAPEEEILGSAFLGKRVLLCHGRADDGRNDRTVFGTSL